MTRTRDAYALRTPIITSDFPWKSTRHQSFDQKLDSHSLMDNVKTIKA